MISNKYRFIIDGEEYPLLSSEYMLTSKGILPNLYEHDDNPDECIPAFVSLDI